MRAAVAVSPFPVPRCLAGKISEETAYSTPYIICTVGKSHVIQWELAMDGLISESGPPTLLKRAYPQFHPSSAGELRAVVLANKNVPVSPAFTPVSLSNVNPWKQSIYSPAEAARVPRLPMNGRSTNQPAINALGVPTTEIMTCCALVWHSGVTQMGSEHSRCGRWCSTLRLRTSLRDW